MADIQLTMFNGVPTPYSDLALQSGRFALEEGFATAVYISLFTDRSATAAEIAAAGLDPEDRRGWWGNLIPPLQLGDGRRWELGSRLWLLKRRKKTRDTLQDAERFAAEALAWMIEDGLAARIDIETEWLARPEIRTEGWLGIRVAIHDPRGEIVRYFYEWNHIRNSLGAGMGVAA